MLITIDVGNSHSVIGIYEGERLLNHWRISTVPDRTTDEHGALLNTLLSAADMEPGFKPEGVVIACVVPPLNQVMEQLAQRYFRCDPLIVGPGVKTGMPILYENPKEVGADRIVNAVAAYERYSSACIVVDFGTATSFDYVTGKGEYAGGAIAPGMGVSMNALIEHAAKLYRVELVAPARGGRPHHNRVDSVGTHLRLHRAGGWSGRANPEGARRKGARDCHRRPGRPDRARKRND